MNYASIIVRQYAEGIICITTDRIGSYLSNQGGSQSLWRKILEWTGQKESFETISIGVINNCLIPYRDKLELLSPIYFRDISLNDITNVDIAGYDLLYFIGLPVQSSEDLEEKLKDYISDGGGLLIEVPDISGKIQILNKIDSVYCTSVNKPLFSNSYWTEQGQNHYIYSAPVTLGFLTTIDTSQFSSEWIPLMTNIVTEDVIGSNIGIDTSLKMGSDFGISYTIAMQNGIITLEEDLSTSSSSSFDSSSSSSSSSEDDSRYWSFCSNVVAYWKMDENNDSSIVWDQSGNFNHMGFLKSNSTEIYTSSSHVSGIINGALYFDGSTNEITTYANQSLNFNGITNDSSFSLNFWIYPESVNGHVMSKYGVWEIKLTSQILDITMFSSTGYRTYSMSAINIPLNEWSNISIVYDGTFTGIKMYYDGTEETVTSSQLLYTTMSNVNSILYFASNNSSNYFNGRIDNVFVVNRELDSIEVDALWNNGRGTDQCEGFYVFSSSSSSTSSSSSSSTSESSSSSSSSGCFFVEKGNLDDGVDATNIWGDGTYIYTACGSDGLKAYTFNGSAFTNVGNINDGGYANSVWGDGTYIYLANNDDGLRAYTFNGSTFTNVGNIDDGNYANGVWGDGTYIYLANGSEVIAYTFNGSTFTNVDSANDYSDANGVWGDGTYIYVSFGEYLVAYTFSGSTFTNVGNIYYGEYSNSVWGDGTYIYLTCSSDGLRAYTFNQIDGFVNVGNIDDGGYAYGVWGDGTYIYSANYTDGLRAYTFNGSTFTNVANIDDYYIGKVWGDGTYVYTNGLEIRAREVYCY